LIVLPGETIRKYSRLEPSVAPAFMVPALAESEAASEQAVEEFAQAIAAAADQAAPEPAAPPTEERAVEYDAFSPDHPFAGFATAVALAPEPEPTPAPAPVAVSAPQPVAETSSEVTETTLPGHEGPTTTVSELEVGYVTEEAITQAADFEDALAIDEADLVPTADGAEDSDEEATADASGEGSETPGAEGAPAITASVREQDKRYPHRVSRRMRRRNRGDRPQGGEPRQAGDRSPVAVADAENSVLSDEVKSVEAREERQPERERGERPERAERAERPERSGSERGERAERPERKERERPPLPSIADLLKEGQEIIVQIAKEPIGQKGARITSHIALPGRFVVYMPTVDHAGVSRKIPSDEERQRLKRIIQTHRQGIPGGYICRTAAEGKTEEELKSDMHFLYNLWLDMRQKAEKRPAPVLLHHDLDLVQRILRDQLTTSFKTIWVDSEELYESVLRFAERFQPALVSRVKLYTRPAPIFDEFGVTAEIEKALRPKVWLKSGGYIVINQTEALVAIDINTGKYVGKSNRLEDTIVKINTDAIKEIVRQIRIRDLGGIIVVDFIDMDERKNKQKVMQALEEAMRVDRAPYKILQFNDFGLVAITRKRVKQSLERTLCSPCPYCEGAGHVKSAATVVAEILTEATKMRKAFDDKDGNVVLRVNPEIAKVLKNNRNQFLQEMEETLGRAVLVKSDPQLHQSKFDLA
jgi:ribonuclease G